MCVIEPCFISIGGSAGPEGPERGTERVGVGNKEGCGVWGCVCACVCCDIGIIEAERANGGGAACVGVANAEFERSCEGEPGGFSDCCTGADTDTERDRDAFTGLPVLLCCCCCCPLCGELAAVFVVVVVVVAVVRTGRAETEPEARGTTKPCSFFSLFSKSRAVPTLTDKFTPRAEEPLDENERCVCDVCVCAGGAERDVKGAEGSDCCCVCASAGSGNGNASEVADLAVGAAKPKQCCSTK